MSNPAPKPEKKGTRKLANSPRTEHHVDALAKKIMEDPAFSLLHETARKMQEKHGIQE